MAGQQAQALEHANELAAVREAHRKGDADLSNLMKSKKSLAEIDFNKFCVILKRQADSFRWPTVILDLTTADNTDDEYKALDQAMDTNDDPVQISEWYTHKNAFKFIVESCEDHADADAILQGVAENRARAAFEALHDYFRPRTTAGKSAAFDKLAACGNHDQHRGQHSSVVCPCLQQRL